MAKKQPKQIEVIDMGDTKTVAKKTSWVKKVKRIFLVITIIWLALVAWFPFYVRNHYSQPIKKSIVVSMFFDLQRNIQEQYERLLKGIAGAIDIKKPIGIAVDKVKLVEAKVEKVSDATASAKATTGKVSKLSGIAGKLGVNTGAADNAVAKANNAIAQVDNTAKIVNDKLESVKNDLETVAQTEIDKALDEQIKKFLDKQSGGLGTTMLTNYGIKHVMPWKPSTWPITTKIYNDLEKSSVDVIHSLTAMVDKYFGYVMWAIMGVIWLAGLFIWIKANGYVKQLTAPFIVCPRCGHTFADRKRLAMGLLKVFQPWKWFGI
jgi:hypothetical protein